jgi:hypothetical protein
MQVFTGFPGLIVARQTGRQTLIIKTSRPHEILMFLLPLHTAKCQDRTGFLPFRIMAESFAVVTGIITLADCIAKTTKLVNTYRDAKQQLDGYRTSLQHVKQVHKYEACVSMLTRY